MIENIDWSAPTTPCQTEGCGHPNYHVCLYKKPDLFEEAIKTEAKRKRAKRRTGGGYRSEGRLIAISEAQVARWDRERAKNKERDEAIVARWKQDPPVSLRTMGEFYGISKNGVMAILKRAIDAGDTEIILRTRADNGRKAG